jgi:hypothetical protein
MQISPSSRPAAEVQEYARNNNNENKSKAIPITGLGSL